MTRGQLDNLTMAQRECVRYYLRYKRDGVLYTFYHCSMKEAERVARNAIKSFAESVEVGNFDGRYHRRTKSLAQESLSQRYKFAE